jgi:hypothetical protein
LRAKEKTTTAVIEHRFRQLDKDSNGELAGEELAAPRWLVRLDLDKDGRVTLDEAKLSFGAGTPAAAASSETAASPRQEPKRLKPADAGIGRMIPDTAFADLDGKQRRLTDFSKNTATVIALISPSCPVSKRYLPSLARLAAEFREKNISLLLVAPTASESPDELRSALATVGLAVPCIPDPAGALSRSLGATATTDVFVLDSRRTLIYRGALDDQYGLGYSLDQPRHRYVSDAIAALLQGRTPTIAATEAPGCVLDFAKAQPVALVSGTTYHNRISRIVQANCLECHRTGGVAPFNLETYEQVTAKAGMIRRMVERRLMPPWFAAPPAPGEHSPWINDRSLADSDREDLLAWLANGKPLGDPSDAPHPRQWPGEWQIGPPDAIYQVPEPIAVKASGAMPYQNVFVETGLTEDKWVEALEILPTSREVVHHVLVFIRDKAYGAARGRDTDDGIHGFFAAYVPGNSYVVYPENFAKALPAGSRLHFQIHYTPNGTATVDQLKLGIRFAKKPPQHVVQVAGIHNLRLKIPPGAENHPETGSIPVPVEVKLLSFTPHLHVRGKAFRYELHPPNGGARTLLDIPRYDFNWQLSYRYAEPFTVPAGSRVTATGWFDNSANNPANPDPTKAVRWGPQTDDEMMLGYVEYFLPKSIPRVARN